MTRQEHRSIPCNVMRYTPLLLLLFVFSAGVERAYSQSCPVVLVSCPDSSIGSSPTFSANVSGGDPSAKLTFNWTVSAGKITAGQGTTSITVDKTGFGDQPFTATVEVGGLPDNCGNKASCATPTVCPPPPTARKFDEYGDLSWAEERARLDKFAGFLKPSIKRDRALHHRRSPRRRAMRRLTNLVSKMTPDRRIHESTRNGKVCSRDLVALFCFV